MGNVHVISIHFMRDSWLQRFKPIWVPCSYLLMLCLHTFWRETRNFWRGNVWLSGWEAFIQYIWSISRWKERIFWCDFMRFKNSACEQWQWMLLNSTSNKTTKQQHTTKHFSHLATPPKKQQVTQLILIESVKKTRSWNGLQWPTFPQRSAWYKTPKEQKPWHRLGSCGSGLVTPTTTLFKKGFN